MLKKLHINEKKLSNYGHIFGKPASYGSAFIGPSPLPFKKNIDPLLKLFKSRGISSTIRSFLSFEDENTLSLSSKICAQGQKHLKISYNTPRTEQILDIKPRKDMGLRYII